VVVSFQGMALVRSAPKHTCTRFHWSPNEKELGFGATPSSAPGRARDLSASSFKNQRGDGLHPENHPQYQLEDWSPFKRIRLTRFCLLPCSHHTTPDHGDQRHHGHSPRETRIRYCCTEGRDSEHMRFISRLNVKFRWCSRAGPFHACGPCRKFGPF
jgi:hypothetical protein